MSTLSDIKEKVEEFLDIAPDEPKLSTRQEHIEASKTNKIVGNNLTKFRNEAGLTRQELADKLSITAANIGSFEVGRKTISARYLAKFMKLFNKDINDFLVK